MEPTKCPYLGLPDDPRTSLAFPSEGNFCHKAEPADSPSAEHQSVYCLSGQHAACPVYRMRGAEPLPLALVSPQSRRAQARSKLGTYVLIVLGLLIYLASTWFSGARLVTRVMSIANLLPFGAGQPPAPAADLNASPLLAVQPEATPVASLTPTPLALVTQACPLPAGWQPYTVQPTDSLWRVAVLFGLDEATLRQANCLDSQAFLTPGSILYVPAPSPTATPTKTPWPVLVAPNADTQSNAPASVRSKPAPTQAAAPAPAPTKAPKAKPSGGGSNKGHGHHKGGG